jgi:hypothetical protein
MKYARTGQYLITVIRLNLKDWAGWPRVYMKTSSRLVTLMQSATDTTESLLVNVSSCLPQMFNVGGAESFPHLPFGPRQSQK